MSFYRNKENYSDPTAGEALSRIAWEEKKKRTRRQKRQKRRVRVWKEKEHEYASVSKPRK